MDFSKLLHGFVKIDTWIFKIDTWTSLSCYMDLSSFFALCQAHLSWSWPRYWSSMKILHLMLNWNNFFVESTNSKMWGFVLQVSFLVEACSLAERTQLSLDTQCLGSVVALSSKVHISWKHETKLETHESKRRITFVNWTKWNYEKKIKITLYLSVVCQVVQRKRREEV